VQAIYTEAMANPTLVVADLPALAAIAHGAGTKLIVDNTVSEICFSRFFFRF
jgi:methionine-gamma-lyase